MGFGTAAPSLLSVALPILIFLVVQAVGDAPEENTPDDGGYEPYEYEPAYADGTDGANDLLDNFGYGTDSIEEYAGYGEDSLFYYSDEYDEYYNTYGVYADEYGYDYFDSDKGGEPDCQQDDNGKTSTKGAIQVSALHSHRKHRSCCGPPQPTDRLVQRMCAT
jgi:hypothetical protein